MMHDTIPETRRPGLEPLDDEVDHVRGPTRTLFIDGVVHRGGHDAATLTEALAG